jgi:hypothetical protein
VSGAGRCWLAAARPLHAAPHCRATRPHPPALIARAHKYPPQASTAIWCLFPPRQPWRYAAVPWSSFARGAQKMVANLPAASPSYWRASGPSTKLMQTLSYLQGMQCDLDSPTQATEFQYTGRRRFASHMQPHMRSPHAAAAQVRPHIHHHHHLISNRRLRHHPRRHTAGAGGPRRRADQEGIRRRRRVAQGGPTGPHCCWSVQPAGRVQHVLAQQHEQCSATRSR